MIGRIKTFFTHRSSTGDLVGEKDVVPLAVCALMMEMAHADGEFSDEELGHIIDILKDEYHISVKEMDELIALADDERKEAIDLWQFSRQIRDNCSREEQRKILTLLWKVVYADGHLDKHEDYLMHKLANVFDLTHKELIGAKIAAKGE
tara:strand:- start:346 stop:792 length:447 start_codon:yes stop_codon:yes gene_type:complete